MKFRDGRIADILCCPACRGSLISGADSLTCEKCGAAYPFREGAPVLMTPDSLKALNPLTAVQEKTAKAKLLTRAIFSVTPCHVTIIDDSYLRAFDGLPRDALILNLGSGGGLFDKSVGREMINMDVFLNDRVHAIGDAHRLPFKDASFDGVFSNAVLEHVAKPWIVAKEIERVLKPGGIVSVNLPFMNVIHEAHDFFRFTAMGIRSVFDGMEEVTSGVSAAGGSFWPVYLKEYLSLFIPGKYPRIAFGLLWGMVFYWFKWLDILIKTNPRRNITATSFYFVGRRKGGEGR